MMTLLFGIKDVMWQPFCFQNKDTITLGQAFLSITLKIFEQTLRPENLKNAAMATVAAGYPQNLISSISSWGKQALIIW